MHFTQNYKLKKPEQNEYALVTDLNENADIIDAELLKIGNSQTEVKQQLTTHLAESMPHTFVDNGKTYRWGFRAVDGEPEFIYEEVL